MTEKVEIAGCELWHGDCKDILPNLPKSDLLLTDPPYGIGKLGGKWGKRDEWKWDMGPAENIEHALSAADDAIIWGGNYFSLPASRGWLAWWKRDSVPSAADIELAWTSIDMNSRLIDQTIAATNAERCGHPTQKPVRVMEWCLTFASRATTVCDPYMGSGSTGVACVNAGKRFIGIEIDLRYFDMACERVERAAAQGQLFATSNT